MCNTNNSRCLFIIPDYFPVDEFKNYIENIITENASELSTHI